MGFFRNLPERASLSCNPLRADTSTGFLDLTKKFSFLNWKLINIHIFSNGWTLLNIDDREDILFTKMLSNGFFAMLTANLTFCMLIWGTKTSSAWFHSRQSGYNPTHVMITSFTIGRKHAKIHQNGRKLDYFFNLHLISFVFLRFSPLTTTIEIE